ncbi:MAG: hypothetical protein RJA22_1104 [Verrucomicrobiota bacterium]
MEIRVECDCGVRFEFEVYPLHGRMPQRVACPGCGADRTAAANLELWGRLEGERLAAAGLVPGVVGAVLAGAVGMLAWFFLIQSTGHQLGFAAWGVGLLVGLGARALGREGGSRLGWAAAGCAAVAVVGGQWLAIYSPAGGLGWMTPVWLVMAVGSAFRLAATRTCPAPRRRGGKAAPA